MQDVVKALLNAPGVQKKACAMDQMTALHFGAMNGHTEVCRVLLNAGIPVNTKTRKAITPLHFACQKGVLRPYKSLDGSPRGVDKSECECSCGHS